MLVFANYLKNEFSDLLFLLLCWKAFYKFFFDFFGSMVQSYSVELKLYQKGVSLLQKLQKDNFPSNVAH